MNASGRHPTITRPMSGTSSKKGFTPNSWPSWKRCWRWATATSACAGAPRKAGPTPKTAPSSTGSMKPGRSSTARKPTASRNLPYFLERDRQQDHQALRGRRALLVAQCALLTLRPAAEHAVRDTRPGDPLGNASRQTGADYLPTFGLVRASARGRYLLSCDAPQHGGPRRNRFGDGGQCTERPHQRE